MYHIDFGVIIGLGLFIIPLWAYRRGLKDGLALNQGKPIEPIQNPVQAYRERKEEVKQKVENDKVTEGWNNIMAYDGTDQKKDGDK